MLTAIPSGDDLGILLFFVAAAVTALIAAAQEKEWGSKRWLFILLACSFFLCGLFLSTIKSIFPALNEAAIALGHNAFFPWMCGGLVGLALGHRATFVLKRKKIPSLEMTYQETRVRIERDRSSTYKWVETEKKNVYGVFQIWNPQPAVVIKEFSMPQPKLDIVIPELFPTTHDTVKQKIQQFDTFFIIIDQPIPYSKINIDSFGHIFPKHDIYFTTNRSAILYVREQLPEQMNTFEVVFVA